LDGTKLPEEPVVQAPHFILCYSWNFEPVIFEQKKSILILQNNQGKKSE